MGNSVGIRHEATGSRKINFTPFKPFNHYEAPRGLRDHKSRLVAKLLEFIPTPMHFDKLICGC